MRKHALLLFQLQLSSILCVCVCLCQLLSHRLSGSTTFHLEVDGYLYRDFDEIIARHMDPVLGESCSDCRSHVHLSFSFFQDPIMDNLRLLQEHKRFGLRNGTLLEKTTVEQAMRQISSDNHMLHYTLLLNFDEPGHGDLLWCMQGRSVRHELIEITPRGFSLWKHNFDSLEQMISWFKKVGWRNAQKLRRDYKEDRKLQAQVLKDKRGDHADPEHRFKRHRPLGYTATTTSGLQTPSGQSARFSLPKSQMLPPLRVCAALALVCRAVWAQHREVPRGVSADWHLQDINTVLRRRP